MLICEVTLVNGFWTELEYGIEIAPESIVPIDCGSQQAIALFHFSRKDLDCLGWTEEEAKLQRISQPKMSWTTYFGLNTGSINQEGILINAHDGTEIFRYVAILRADRAWFEGVGDFAIGDGRVTFERSGAPFMTQEVRHTNPIFPSNFHKQWVVLRSQGF